MPATTPADTDRVRVASPARRDIRLGDLPTIARLATHHVVALVRRSYQRTVAAGAILRDPDGRLLLVETGVVQRGWDLPGGRIEGQERPDEGVVREVREEVGLAVQVGRLLLVDARRRGRLVFVFECTVAGGALQLAPGEIHAARWVDPAELTELRLKAGDRIPRAVAAAERGDAVYLPERTIAP